MALAQPVMQKRPSRLFRNMSAKIAAVPMIITALGAFVGCTAWSVLYSFTKSRSLPAEEFVGFMQYERLFSTRRWLASVDNILIFGACSLVISFVFGFVLAALMDQKIRFENTFRTIFLYPFAMSFIVTGLVWQWILNPDLGVPNFLVEIGLMDEPINLLGDRDLAIYGVLLAGLWQGSGLVMIIMLAGLRGIDDDIWKASRVDGIPMWKTYLLVVIPMMKPVFVTTLVLVAAGIVKVYDLIVAQTSGGPGFATEMPAKYVYDHLFARSNLGQALAASTVMLTTVLIILVPYTYLEYGKQKRT